ncbi:MAG: sulfatase-like hydrolase/transferase [Planctomycetota bacterium]
MKKLALAMWFAILGVAHAADERPNILWITSEDNGQQLGCYGDEYADTPNLDRLAERSLRFKTCWSNAPVCAPARTTIISGMYATSLGGQHMRSGVRLPRELKLYPELLREAGYYCTNNSKTDYNFADADAGWDDSGKKASYKNRPDANTPFFAVFNFTVSHESKIRVRPHTPVHDPAGAPIPAYHPDTPEVRRDWAQYYDKLTEMDTLVGKTLDELDQAGLRDSTIIFYYGDHGSGMPRSKRQPFDSGLRVPLLVSIPKKFRHLAPKDYADGEESDRLVGFVDLAPTALSLAGVKSPTSMQGVPFLGRFAGEAKQYLFGYRGRMDERVDMVRSCTDGRYVYLRYFYPDRPYLKHVDYMFQTPTTRVWKELFDAGKLNEAQAKFWKTRPAEELFDLQSDPWEVTNLADRPEYQERVEVMRAAVADWMIQTRDTGLMPEAEMHERVGETSPREYAMGATNASQRWVRLAMSATDVESDLKPRQLVRLSANEDSVIRFWAVRGLALRGEVDALMKLTEDANASVAIAACDGVLASSADDTAKRSVTQRLIELSDVEAVGHFAAVAALNVLDTRAELNAEDRKRISELPRQLRKPPPRVGKYVGRLLDKLAG